MLATKSEPLSYQFGAFRLIPSERQFLHDGTPVSLPPKAFEMLVLLVENGGHLIEKEELMQKLWPDTFVEEANLTHQIWTLRKALGEKESEQKYIETVPRRGYRFVANVQVAKHKTAHAVSGPTAQSEASPHVPDAKAVPRLNFRRHAVALLLALVITAILGLGYFTYARLWASKSTARSKIVLLVLPFKNPSGNPEEQYFSDGMTEEMITELANLRPERLRVIPRVSVVQVTSTGKAVDQIAKELGVDYVLDCSVYRSNDRVRINARLIKARDQEHVWAHSYERELRDVLILQNEVASSISQEIALQLNAADQTQAATIRQIDPEAHEAYLKGLYFFDKFTESGMRTSIEYFRQAIAREPRYAPPYARMARAYGVLGNFSSLRPEDAYPKEKEAAQKALEIDGGFAEARTALGWAMLFYDRDWTGARQEFERAIELSPNLASAHQGYATYFVAMGEFDRAEAEILQAQQLDPVNLNIKGDVGWFRFFARRTDESIVQLKQVVEMDPNFAIAHVFLAYAYQQKGMFDEAVLEEQKAVTLFGGNEYRISSLGEAYARAGRKQEAQEVLARLKKASRDYYISPYNTGLVYLSLGQTDEALNWLEKAYNERFWMMVFLKVDPRWDSVRSHPRFVDIMRRMGFASQR
jgi:TolB-like protein/DNA-binding winged helix-turn-helix (wHTH) protein/Tfp pilus assembly protein PilF